MLLWAGRLKRLIKQFSGYKSGTREVDLLMRRNKTSLTAHHFMSAPSDSLSHSFPVYLFVSSRHHQNAYPRLLRPVGSFIFFSSISPLWPVTDTSVQSINLSLPQSGTALFLFPSQSYAWTERARRAPHVSEAVTLNGINIWWRWRKNWRSNQSALLPGVH